MQSITYKKMIMADFRLPNSWLIDSTYELPTNLKHKHALMVTPTLKWFQIHQKILMIGMWIEPWKSW